MENKVVDSGMMKLSSESSVVNYRVANTTGVKERIENGMFTVYNVKNISQYFESCLKEEV